MKKSLNINAMRDGKKVSKTFGFINPEQSNAVADEFARRVNALTNDNFLNAEIVKKMDTTEADAVIKTIPTLTLGGWSSADTVYTAAVTYDGDGELSTSTGTISGGVLTVNDADGTFSGIISASEGDTSSAVSLSFNRVKELTKKEGIILIDGKENPDSYYPGDTCTITSNSGEPIALSPGRKTFFDYNPLWIPSGGTVTFGSGDANSGVSFYSYANNEYTAASNSVHVDE